VDDADGLEDQSLEEVSRQVHRDHRHRSVGRGGARAAVFGASDGLVSNVSLILGVAGADPDPSVVRLAGIAGLIAGAVSMAAGEYVSMRAQSELLERELAVEREAQRAQPELERIELAKIYESRGMEPELARELADSMMRDPDLALETHAREELGIDPHELGSPIGAAVWSFGAFSVGAVVPLVPWLLGGGTAAVVASVLLGALAAAIIGAILATFTGRPRWFSALRQTAIAAVAAGVTWVVGSLVGVSV
jgi:VIT1/CCC1 family predicted Fe2+/Mn2+ transporter